MKLWLTLLFALVVSSSFGQTARNIRFRIYPKDSVNIHMDEKYGLMEDTCSTVIRYGHFRKTDKKFFGPFRDLNKYDPSIVLAEGKYTDDGKLDGPFKSNYLTGEPQAEGKFERGEMIGPWVIYFPGNKKRVEFEGNSLQTKINNAWDETGKQTVVNGAGSYRSDLGFLYWEGKLVDGRPDGVWRAKKTDDRTGTVVSSETHKNGLFVRGSSPAGNYADASRISLANESLLPISNANSLRTSAQACDPSMSRKKIVYAVYEHGMRAFSEKLKEVVLPVFSKVDLAMYPFKTFQIRGTIDPKGRFENFVYIDGWQDRQSSALVQALFRLPYMEPTLVDGKPVPSTMLFSFKIEQGLLTYSSKMEQVKPN